MTVRLHRWLRLALLPLVATASLAAVPASPAPAAPKPTPSSSTPSLPDEQGDDDEDGLMLNDVLESSTRKYVQAKTAVETSVKQQAILKGQLQTAKARLARLQPELDKLAVSEYTLGGRMNALSSLLSADNPGDFLAKAGSLSEINSVHDETLREVNAVVRDVSAKTEKLDAELAAQQNYQAAMQKQHDSAQQALALLGGKSLTQGDVDAVSKQAAPAPRNADGGFSPEKCTEKDPTTSGCITKRTLHLYNEVRKAGFNRFVGCHRDGGPYEHPKGRACDWSLQMSGFSEAYNQDTKRYGNDLMAFLVRNADRLGIYYVIWYAQIWFPGQGWHAYHGPSNHKDHVHVSLL